MELIDYSVLGYGDGYGDGYGSGYGRGYGRGDGDGGGYGSGNGDGSGYGDGYGDGGGYGYGSGYGNGNGYGYGSGDGNGDGRGYGDGRGDGSGYGYGDGDGSGYGSLDLEFSQLLAAHLGSQAAPELAKEKCVFAYWKSNKDGTPANGGSGGARKAGDVEEIKGPLKLCGPGALHATHHLQKWDGQKLWLVALHGEVQVSDSKIGALKRTIICEVDKKAVGL